MVIRPIGLALFLFAAVAGFAQQSALPRDPLMTLMLSQPRIEITNVAAVATFEPRSIRPGQEAVYRVTFNALEESIAFPTDLAATPPTEIRPGAHGQMLQMGPGVLQPISTFVFHVRPANPGTLRIPEFTVKVYEQTVTVPAAQLEVSPDLPVASAPQRLTLDFPATNLYVGQPVRARVLSAGAPGAPVQGLAQMQLTGQGFIVDQGSIRQRFEARPGPGGNSIHFIYEVVLTPLTAGKLSVFAQGFAPGNRGQGLLIVPAGGVAPTQPSASPRAGENPAGPSAAPAAPAPPGVLQVGGTTVIPQYTLLDSDPVELSVKPLPRKGELPGFTGAVGIFAMDSPALETNVVVIGDPIKLFVTVHGEDSSVRMVPPPPPTSSDWQMVISPVGSVPPKGFPSPGSARRPAAGTPDLPITSLFTYTLVALSKTATNTPTVPFSYFDPKRGEYVDLTIPALPVTIKDTEAPADTVALRAAESLDAAPEVELALSDLAGVPGLSGRSLVPFQQRGWFAWAQAAPGMGFFALWGWSRRRRYLELHPDIVLRRRARRALRRECHSFRQAARRGDAFGFANAAVNALCVASAPHYPAEPRALVGADVLAVLPEAARTPQSSELMRRFFAARDAAVFSERPAAPNELVALQPELERLLETLEATLC